MAIEFLHSLDVAGDIKVEGKITDKDGVDRSSNWNTAYSWGNHADAGYLTSASNFYTQGVTFDTDTGVLLINVNGATNRSVDLDGRYLVKSHKGGDDYFGGHHPEGRVLANAVLANDLANLRLRGGSISVTNHEFTDDQVDLMFDGTGRNAGINTSKFENGPVVIEIGIPRELKYSAYVGIGFGHPNWRCKKVRIEAYTNGNWVECIDEQNNLYEDVYANIPGNSSPGTTRFKFTLDDPNSNVRICHIWAYNYDSRLWSELMMPRAGGTMYGSLTVNGTLNNHTIPSGSGTLALTSNMPTDFVSKANGGSFGGDVAIGPKNNATVQVSESGGATVKMLAGSVGRVGTYSDDELRIVTDGSDRLKIDTSGNSTFEGVVRTLDGTASVPAYSFSGDTNTGIFKNVYSGTNMQLNITVDGSTKASFNSAGITSHANVYSNATSSFRNYSGVWKGTTGITGNGFEFNNTVDGTAMTLSSTGNAVFTGSVTANGTVLTGDQVLPTDFVSKKDGGAFGGDISLSGNLILTGSSNEIIKSNGSIRINIDSDGNQEDRIFIVSTGSNSELFRVDESGNGTFKGILSATGYNSANWDTAYGWGDHSSAGYLTALPSHNHDGTYLRTHARLQNNLRSIASSGVYVWDVSEADDKPTGAADGLLTVKYWDSSFWATASFQDFHNRKLYITSKKNGTWLSDWAQVHTTDTFAASDVADGKTAHGWGNHASAGYLTDLGDAITSETNSFLGDGGNASTHPGTSRVIYTGQVSQGSSALGMPTVNNANAFLTLNKHSGEYNSQLGFSSNGHIYYRNFNNTAINGSQTWHQLWTSNNLTNNSSNWDTAYSWGDHSVAGYITRSAPAAPVITSKIVNDTIEVSITASSTANIDQYLVFSSVVGSDFGLISVIPPEDFSATMSVIDNSFDESGQIDYRVYAVKNGVYSSASTTNQTFSAGTLEPVNMNVIAMNEAFYIQWDAPSSNARFVKKYEVYHHSHDSEGSLSRNSATLIYSGDRLSHMVASSDSKFNQFWVEIAAS